MVVDYDEMKYAIDFAKKAAGKKTKKPTTVTDFITDNCLFNEDGFYTPHEEWFETHEAAAAEFRARGWNSYGEVDDAPINPKLRGWLELPYGHICDNCGGSWVAIIELDENKQPINTSLNYCG